MEAPGATRQERLMKIIHVLNGPSLNLLGQRQPEIYGHDTLDDIESRCRAILPDGFDLIMRQSNHEGVLVDWIQEARGCACAIVINAAAYRHTSLAILDALNTYEGLVFEIHISNVHRRESFRHHSHVATRADGVLTGLGTEGYDAAIRRICALLA
tara:strand:+ start:692 stop:1159 length:468 start_codon:yes stop_codon:yes gene_type:complete